LAPGRRIGALSPIDLPEDEQEEIAMNATPQKNPAEMYEQFFVPAMFLPWSGVLLRHAALRPGERVLDIACGTGIVAREAAPRVGAKGRIVAVDANPAMLGVARGLPAPAGAPIEWREGNAMALPVPDSSFDVALCQHGLQFFPDRAGAVREMHRVLVPGGRAAVIVLQALSRHPVFEALMESTARHLALPIAAVSIPFVLCDADELRGWFTAAGFAQVAIVADSITVRFPESERFVPLAVTSSAAAVPAFAELDAPARAALLQAVRDEAEPVVRQYRDRDAVTFPMHAHVVLATR
jgi:SAM-dependent methyltransferase